MLINEKKLYLLPLYRLSVFKLFNFKTDSKDEQIIIIANALNIKSRKKRITYIYDSACEYIDNFYNGENICGFKNCKCYVQRSKHLDNKNGCCRFCIYATDKGCPSKNLACKLFNCSEVYSRRKVLTYKDLKTLKVLSVRQRYILKSGYFSLREDVLKDLYSYSIIYAVLRIYYRLIRNWILRKRRTKK